MNEINSLEGFTLKDIEAHKKIAELQKLVVSLQAEIETTKESINNFVPGDNTPSNDLETLKANLAKLESNLSNYQGKLAQLQSTVNNIKIADKKCTIHVLNSPTTQDIILIKANGKNILVDAGRASDAVTNYAQLVALNANKIDVVVITHYHYDHAGGLVNLVSLGLDVQKAYLFLPPKPSTWSKPGWDSEGEQKCFSDIEAIATNYEMQKNTPAENETFAIDGETTFLQFFNTSHLSYYLADVFDYNDCCLCTMLVHGNKRVFLSADIGQSAQSALVGKLPKVDLLKVEHHGLNAEMNEDFYATLTPEMCFTCNGKGDAGRGSVYVHSKSAVQSYLERMGIPNYCTSNNDNLKFTIGENSINVNGRSFNQTTNIVDHTSFMSAVECDYTSDVKNLTIKELCMGMKPDTHLVTQIDDTFKIWEMVAPFISSNIGSATLDLHKVGSSDIRGNLGVTTGYFHIYPRTTNSFTVGLLYGSFYYNPAADNPEFGCVVKQLNPMQAQYFKWNPETLKYELEQYSGFAFTLNENGEILSTYSGLAKIWATVTNNSEVSKEYTLEDSANGSSTRIRAKVKCAPNSSVTFCHMESVSATSIIKILQDGAELDETDDCRVMIESLNRYQGHYFYSEGSAE